MMEAVAQAFEKIFKREPEVVCFAPGRVNLIGEHTDYNGGHVFPCALNMGIKCAAAKRDDDELHFFSRDITDGCEVVYNINAVTKKSCWADYPASVVRALASFGHKINKGADMYFSSDLPFGSGLSSSAALEVVAGTALRELFSLWVTLQELALIGQFAENRFIGVNCGIMDQFASAMGKKGNAILLDSNTLEFEYAPLGGADIVIVNSGVKHSLASSEYNIRRRECESAMNALGVQSLCSMSPEEFEAKKHLITDDVCRKRAAHAVYEERRTVNAASALIKGDLRTFGALMNESHMSLKDDYEVSCAELDFLSETARELSYVYGARMTGGGFGGCTVNLLESGRAEEFEKTISGEYEKSFGIIPKVYLISAWDGAKRIS